MEKVLAKDSLGNPINMGDYITYPVRVGSSMWSSFAVVTSVKYVKNDSYWGDPNKLIPDISITVLSGPWDFKPHEISENEFDKLMNSGRDEFKLTKSKLYRYDRAIVLPRGTLVTKRFLPWIEKIQKLLGELDYEENNSSESTQA